MVCEKDPALKNRCHIRYIHLFSTIKYKVSISVSNALGHNATAITFDEFTIGTWEGGPCCSLQWECVSGCMPEGFMSNGGMHGMYIPVNVRVNVYLQRPRDLSSSSSHPLSGSHSKQEGEGAGWARPLCSCSLHPPTLIASLRPVMNEVSEQETGLGQILHSPQSPSQPDPRLPAPSHGWVPRQTPSAYPGPLHALVTPQPTSSPGVCSTCGLSSNLDP